MVARSSNAEPYASQFLQVMHSYVSLSDNVALFVQKQALRTVHRARRAIVQVPEPYVDMLEVYWEALETARAVGCTEDELVWPDNEDYSKESDGIVEYPATALTRPAQAFPPPETTSAEDEAPLGLTSGGPNPAPKADLGAGNAASAAYEAGKRAQMAGRNEEDG